MNHFSLPTLPFSVGFYTKRPKGLPEVFPFTLTEDADSGLITEVMTPEIETALKEFYSLGGYASTPLGEGEYGKAQGEELFKWVTRALTSESKKIEGESFLEIGAGYGFLLSLLKEHGAKKVLGLEPGEEGVIGAKKYSIPMIRDFFPSARITEKFDCILSYGVMEHISSPGHILSEIKNTLTETGLVFIGVPECEQKMRVGDPSIIAHQHINYFTKESLMVLLKNAGFTRVHVESSPRRSMLIGWAMNTREKSKEPRPKTTGAALLAQFQNALSKNVAAIQKEVNAAEADGKTVGFYAPSSNILGLVKCKKSPRIFDSDPWKHGKYLTASSVPLESPESLLVKPVDILFICPIDYDTEIASLLEQKGLLENGATRVISLKKIYESESGTRYFRG